MWFLGSLFSCLIHQPSYLARTLMLSLTIWLDVLTGNGVEKFFLLVVIGESDINQYLSRPAHDMLIKVEFPRIIKL
jgi:hypothetical protein